MPFEFKSANAPRKIAIIGAGISGLGTAYHLCGKHDISLFEVSAKLGGHARTIYAGRKGDRAVDTGFIVFNRKNYPHLCALFNALDVPIKKSNMSFSVSLNNGRFEYGMRDLGTIFAQPRNILRPQFYKMLRDIIHFNKHGFAFLNDNDPDMPLRDLLDRLDTGQWHRAYYLLPLSGAIWSTTPDEMLNFPASTLLQFLANHGLLRRKDHLQWHTVAGGAMQYVIRLEKALRSAKTQIHTNSPVMGVKRHVDGVSLRLKKGEWKKFDAVVFACHSDQALDLLSDPTQCESHALSAIKYQRNTTVLHADPSMMPKRKRAWSSWNYVNDHSDTNKPVGVSYWMNLLQSLPDDDLLIQSLNPCRTIREELIYDEHSFMHPIFDSAAIKAQEQIKATQGQNHTYYAGAWLGHGFHEDGYQSAINVAQYFGLGNTLCA